VLTNKL